MDAGKAQEFLHLIRCRRVTIGSVWVRSTCPLEHRHRGGSDNKPSFAVRIRPDGSSGCRCLGCGYATDQLQELLWKLEIERGMDTEYASRLLLKHNQISLQYLERTAEPKPEEGDLMGRIAHARTYVSNYDPSKSKFVHPDDEPQAEVPEDTLQQMIKDMPGEVLEYLLRKPDKVNGIEGRGLDRITVAEWELGWHRIKRRLCIPIRDEDGKLVAVSGRKYDEDAWGPKYLHSRFKRDRVLFGEHRVDTSVRKGYLVEGFFQAIRLDQLGYKNALARMGTHLSKQQGEKLVKWFDHLVIVPDGDKAGYESAREIADRFKGRIATIEIAEMPQGKDADSLHPDRLRELLG